MINEILYILLFSSKSSRFGVFDIVHLSLYPPHFKVTAQVTRENILKSFTS